MYYLNFLKWFWNKHLKETHEKVGFCLIIWLMGLTISIISSLIIGTALIFAGYLLFSFAVGLSLLVFTGFMYTRQCYRKWQMEVIDKLKGK